VERTTNLTASPVADAVVGDRDDEGELERLGDEKRSMWKSMGSQKRAEVWPDGRRSGPATRTCGGERPRKSVIRKGARRRRRGGPGERVDYQDHGAVLRSVEGVAEPPESTKYAASGRGCRGRVRRIRVLSDQFLAQRWRGR
jgi:hypothetical protein